MVEFGWRSEKYRAMLEQDWPIHVHEKGETGHKGPKEEILARNQSRGN